MSDITLVGGQPIKSIILCKGDSAIISWNNIDNQLLFEDVITNNKSSNMTVITAALYQSISEQKLYSRVRVKVDNGTEYYHLTVKDYY